MRAGPSTGFRDAIVATREGTRRRSAQLIAQRWYGLSTHIVQRAHQLLLVDMSTQSCLFVFNVLIRAWECLCRQILISTE